MELVVRKNDLLKELSLLQGIVERKNTIPILANVLIEATKDGVSLLATDLDVGLRSRCEATVVKPGTLTLPAKKLFEIVNALPDTEIRIQEDKGGKSVTIAADRFESRMQTLPASEFPTPPQDAGESEATLPGAALKRLISHTRFAITSEDTRYFLNGAQLVLRPDSMSMVATDGHRLAFISVQESPGKGVKSEVLAAPEDTERGRAADRRRRRGRVFAGGEPPVLPHRRPAADFAEDRRELSGVRARDSQDQRQEDRIRSRSAVRSRAARPAACPTSDPKRSSS